MSATTQTQEQTELSDMDPNEIGFDLYVTQFLQATAAAVVFDDYDHPDEVLGCVTNVAAVFLRPKEDTDALLLAIDRLSVRAFGYERTLAREAIIGKKVYPAKYRVKVWAR